MRTFTLSDQTASELWTALNNSTGAGQPQAAKPQAPAAASITREPGYLYPGDPDYPTGGPYAAKQWPFPIPGYVPNLGNPNYKEGDHLPGWSQAGEDLAAAFFAAKTPEEQQAANEKIAAFIGWPGADFSTGTAANTASANFWRANNPHQ